MRFFFNAARLKISGKKVTQSHGDPGECQSRSPWTAFVSFALVSLQVIPYRTVSGKAQVDSFKNKSLSKPSGKSDRLNYKQMQNIEKRGEKVKAKAKDW